MFKRYVLNVALLLLVGSAIARDKQRSVWNDFFKCNNCISEEFKQQLDTAVVSSMAVPFLKQDLTKYHLVYSYHKPGIFDFFVEPIRQKAIQSQLTDDPMSLENVDVLVLTVRAALIVGADVRDAFSKEEQQKLGENIDALLSLLAIERDRIIQTTIFSSTDSLKDRVEKLHDSTQSLIEKIKKTL
jgi:hypothetical protein